MSDRVTNVEIEDVLSSIRRLVSDEARGPVGRAERPMRERLVLTPAQRVREEAAKAEAGRAMPAQDVQPESPRAPKLLAGYELRAPLPEDEITAPMRDDNTAPMRDDASVAPVVGPRAPMPEDDSAALDEDGAAAGGEGREDMAADAGPGDAAHEDATGQQDAAAQEDPGQPEIGSPAFLLREEDAARDAAEQQSAGATGAAPGGVTLWDGESGTADVPGTAEAEDIFAPAGPDAPDAPPDSPDARDATDASALPDRTEQDSAADVFAFHATPRAAPVPEEDHAAPLSDATGVQTGDQTGDETGGRRDAPEPEVGAVRAREPRQDASAPEVPPADGAEPEPAAATAEDADAIPAAEPAETTAETDPATETAGEAHADGPHVTFVHASEAPDPTSQPRADVASGDPQTAGVIGLEDKIARLEAMISRGATPWDPATEEEAEAPPPEDDIAAIPFRTRSRIGAPREEYTFEDRDFDDPTQVEIDCESPFGSNDEALIDEDALRDMVAEIVRQELQGALGERITRNVRKLVRREINRALLSQDFD